MDLRGAWLAISDDKSPSAKPYWGNERESCE